MNRNPKSIGHRNLGNTIAHYTSSIVFRQLLGVVNAYLKPLLLTPQLYGLWNLLNTVLAYSPLTHLGSRSAMRYRIPVNEGRGDEAANCTLMSAAFYGSMFITGMAASGLAMAALVLDLGRASRMGLMVIALVIALEWYAGFRIALLKGRSCFQPITRINYIKALSASILNVVLILCFGIYGLFAALCLTQIIVLCYLRKHAEPLQLGLFRLKVFFQLVREGFPIIAFSMGGILIRSLDRIIITAWLGLEQLGYYGISIMAMNFFMNIPDASREVVEPKLMRDLQVRSEKACLRDYVERPLLATAYGLPLLLGPTILLMPTAVQLLLPRYIQGVLPAQILISGSLFLALTLVLRGIIIARGLQVRATGIMFASVATNAALSCTFIWLGWGITGVALASGCSFLCLFITLFFFVRRREANLLNISLASLAPSLTLTVAAAILVYFFTKHFAITPLVTGPVATIALLLLLVLLYNHVGKRTGFWHSLSSAGMKRIFRR